MEIHENYSLKPFNTFGIEARARYFGSFKGLEELSDLLSFAQVQSIPLLIMGGGSNMLLTRDFDGLVIRNEYKGIHLLREDEDHVWVEAHAGEVWHDFVLYAIERGWGGIENLSLIPGSVGAGPMQNIGAYGVELKDVFSELKAMEISTHGMKTFTAEECAFGYRTSIFKTSLKNQYVITSVIFRLNKKPVVNTTYGAIEQELQQKGIIHPGIREVSEAVIHIRKSKLPDPSQIGNAGSFFKNPEVSLEKFEELKSRYPDIHAFPVKEGMKLAAGWMIEQCGWKGKQIGEAGVHKNQALVLVNYGNAKGEEILQIAKSIQADVLKKFGVELEMEVNII